MKRIAYFLLHCLCPGWFRVVLAFILGLLTVFLIGGLDQAVLAEVGFLELLTGTLAGAFPAGKLVAVTYVAVALDGLLTEDLTMRTIYQITFGISH